MKTMAPVIALSLLASSVGAAEGKAVTLKVFVQAADVKERKKVDDATKQQLKQKRDEEREARKSLEKKLKAELGKKVESWPEAKQDELFEAREKEALADADYSYRKVDPKGLKDSVKDVVESIRGKGMAGQKEHAELVGSAGEAELIVEVEARRAEKLLPTDIRPNACYLLFTIGAGPELKKGRFEKVPANYHFRSWKHAAWKIRSPKPDEPWFYFESSNGGGNEFGCHGTAANGASAVLNKFIEDNYAVLKGR